MPISRLEEMCVPKDPSVRLALSLHCFALKDPTRMKRDLLFAKLVQVDTFVHWAVQGIPATCAHLGTTVQLERSAALSFRACQALMAIKRVFRMFLSALQRLVECTLISMLRHSLVGSAKVAFTAAVERSPVHHR